MNIKKRLSNFANYRSFETRETVIMPLCMLSIDQVVCLQLIVRECCLLLQCAGAYGYFEVTGDITKYCKAKLFEHVGKKTPLFIRFSTVGEPAFSYAAEL